MRRLVAVAALLLAEIVFPLGASALTAEEVADKVQATYKGFSDLQAEFVQRATNRLSGMSQEASGRLFLKWPGKMRWEYDSPEPRLFLVDGKTLWSHSPLERQAGTREGREHLLDLVPKGQDLSFKRVILAIDQESFLIKRLTVFDLYGNTTVVELSELKVNGGLEDGLFKFSPPPGTDLVAPPRRPVP